MSFIIEALSPEEQRFKELARSQERREKAERAERDLKQKEDSLEHRRAYLEYIKSREGRNEPSNVQMEPISDKDKDPTAYQKALSGVGRFAARALSAGTEVARDAMKKRREERAKKAEEAKKAAFKKGLNLNQKRLPPAKSSFGELPPAFSAGRRARIDPEFKKREIERRGGTTEESFSCWREEFLYELGEMRRNKKQKEAEERVIDVMKGQNKITIGPNESETGINEGRKLSRLKTTVKKIAQKAEIPLLATSFALSAGQSPEALIRSGHIEGPGIAGMQRLMNPRKKPKDLDLGRVSHSARNKKLGEELSREELLKAIVLKLINEKKRKNSLLNNQYIGEAIDKNKMKCNKPKAEAVGDSLTGKSHVVKACEGGEEKIIRFGQRGVKGSPKKEGESKAYANRRKRFKARHAKNIAKGKMSAAFWANKIKW